MNILDKIVLRKLEEVAFAKARVSIKALENNLVFGRKPYIFKEFLLAPDRTGIISEFKKQTFN